MREPTKILSPLSFNGGDRLAEQIASSIEADMLALSWPVGMRIGNEDQLASFFGTSRWTIREAVAILEQTGTIAMRLGKHGGLFVSATARDLIRNSLSAFIENANIPFDALIEARLALTAVAVHATIANMTPRNRAEIAGLVLKAEEGGLGELEALSAARNLLWDLTGCSQLPIFLAALGDVSLHACWMSSLDDDAFLALLDRQTVYTRRHCLAMLANDTDAALRTEQLQMEVAAEFHRASSAAGRVSAASNAAERVFAIYPSAKPKKKAEQVSWAIRREIIERHLQPGYKLGSVASLMARYQAGKPVIREAIRILERNGLVEMRRGRNNGLRVAAPDPARVVALARELRDRGPSWEAAKMAAALRPIQSSNAIADLILTIVTD